MTSSIEKKRKGLSLLTGMLSILVAVALGITVYHKTNTYNQEVVQETALRTAVVGSHIAIVLVDEHGIIEMATPAALKVTGYNITELVGQTPDIMVPNMMKTGHQERIIKGIEGVENRETLGTPHAEIPCHIVHASGRKIFVVISVYTYEGGAMAVLKNPMYNGKPFDGSFPPDEPEPPYVTSDLP